jgi:hypothetical protein
VTGCGIPDPVRLEVLERAGFCCEVCGEPAKHQDPEASFLGLDMHHRNRRAADNRPENILLVCEPCHYKQHRDLCPLCGRDFITGGLDSHVNACLRGKVKAGEPVAAEALDELKRGRYFGRVIFAVLEVTGRSQPRSCPAARSVACEEAYWRKKAAYLREIRADLEGIEARLKRLEGKEPTE